MSGALLVQSADRPPGPWPLAELLAAELTRQGVPTVLTTGPLGPPVTGQARILLGPRLYGEHEGFAALGGDAALARMIVIEDGSPAALADPGYVTSLRGAGAVFALDERTAIEQRRFGIPARLLRLGYVPSLDRFDPGAERPIDIVALGSPTPRRARYLGAGAAVFARHRCVLHPQDGPSLLAQTKLAIAFHADDGAVRPDWPAVLDAIHAGAVVVSEPAAGLAPLTAGEHLLIAAPDALPYVAEGLLDDPARIARMRRAAHARVTGWMPFALSVSALRVAVVQIVGQPRADVAASPAAG